MIKQKEYDWLDLDMPFSAKILGGNFLSIARVPFHTLDVHYTPYAHRWASIIYSENIEDRRRLHSTQFFLAVLSILSV